MPGRPIQEETSAPLSQTQEFGMVPVYEERRGGRGPLLGYKFDSSVAARQGKIDVPKPPEILAEEKRLGGKELEPIYAKETIGRGNHEVEYGAPIGYRYDNGNSEYVNFDATGKYQGTVKRQSGIDPAMLAILAMPFVGPALFEALGLTGAAGAEGLASLGAAGAAGGAATPLVFTPEMIAAGMTPGGIGAAGAAKGLLDASQLASLYGVNSGIATLAPTLSQLPSGPPSTPGTPPPPGLEPPLPSGIETLPSGPPSTPGTPPPPNLELPLPPELPIPSGPPSTPGTPPPPNLELPPPIDAPIPSGPPSTPGTPPPPNVGPPGSNIPTPTPGITDLLNAGKLLTLGSVVGTGLSGGSGGSSGTSGTSTIPEFTANRTQLAYDVDKKGVNPNTPYRPGQGGVTYFSPITYTPKTPKAAVEDVKAADGEKKVAGGGLMSLGGMSNLGSYSDGGRLLQGPGDGVSDSIPAIIGKKQPARLANGEFVIPARIVSELGNGSTDAGAKRLYEMMDRIQKVRRKTKNVAANTKAAKYLPA